MGDMEIWTVRPSKRNNKDIHDIGSLRPAFGLRFWREKKMESIDEKSIPKTSHMFTLLKFRTNSSYILQALPWLRTKAP